MQQQDFGLDQDPDLISRLPLDGGSENLVTQLAPPTLDAIGVELDRIVNEADSADPAPGHTGTSGGRMTTDTRARVIAVVQGPAGRGDVGEPATPELYS